MARRNANREKTLVGLAIATVFVVVLQFTSPIFSWSEDGALKSSKQDFLGQPSSTASSTTTTTTDTTLTTTTADVPADPSAFMSRHGGMSSEGSAGTLATTAMDPQAQSFSSLASESTASTSSSSLPAYHIVFSTSCTPQQNWESMVFFYHAMKVKQPGNITRIVSGCDEKQTKELEVFHKEHIKNVMSDSFRLHFTPDYSRVRLSEGKHAYKYMNKPFGLRHWMENGLGMSMDENNVTTDSDLRDGIVMLMDPDMILLRPLLHDFTNEEVIWVDSEKDHSIQPATKVVRHGFPIAQQDGYLNNEWMKLNFSYIVDQPEGSYVTRPEWSDGPLHWNTGPPYLATVGDMYKIVVKWTEYAPRVLDVHPKLFAEMYGFIIATVELEMPFTLIRSIVVSTTVTRDREGWPYVDALPDDQVCEPQPSTDKLPIGLHYCGRYYLGKTFFSKYRLKKNIMNCEKNLLRPPPKDLLGKYDHAIKPPRADLQDKHTYTEEREPIGSKRAKREVFMLCGLVSAVNEALRYHKHHACGGSENLNETYSVHDDPTDW